MEQALHVLGIQNVLLPFFNTQPPCINYKRNSILMYTCNYLKEHYLKNLKIITCNIIQSIS